jgi:hypothetical protein
MEFKVSGDKDKPLEGALVLHNGNKVGQTKSDGVARLRLQGAEGETFSFLVQCPAGYQSPLKPVVVTLRRLADNSKTPEYALSCPPTSRSVVVSVRADNGPNLPIVYLGREVGRTDESGAAHLLLQLRPNEQFELSLNTGGKDAEMLRPQNPVAAFQVKGQDDVFSFDQKFAIEKKKIVAGKGRVGPKPL